MYPNTLALIFTVCGLFTVCGFDLQALTDKRKTLASTSPDQFNMGQLLLLKALMLSPPAAWDDLWLSSLIKSHTVLMNVQSGTLFYVVFAAKHLLYVCELQTFRDGWLSLGRDPGSFTYMCLTNLHDFLCWDYGLGLLSEFQVAATPLDGHTMLTYLLLNVVHLLGSVKI